MPTLLVVMLAGFGIPALQLQGVTTDTFWLGLVALVLSYGAYVAEVFRAGIDSIHPSQVASADALGLSHGQAMRYVVLPQATRRVVPPLLNDFISLQKDTALLSAIFVFEALFTAQDYAAYNFNYTPIVVVAVLFVALTIPLARFTDWMGRRMMRRERAGVAMSGTVDEPVLRTREPAQGLRRQGGAPRHRPGGRAARRDLPDRVVGLGQVDPAALPRPARGHRRRRRSSSRAATSPTRASTRAPYAAGWAWSSSPTTSSRTCRCSTT